MLLDIRAVNPETRSLRFGYIKRYRQYTQVYSVRIGSLCLPATAMLCVAKPAAELRRCFEPFELRQQSLVLAIAMHLPFARAGEPVDLLLVLASDVSRSVDQAKFQLQRQGYAAAISHPRVLNAITSGLHQRIALSFVEWSGPMRRRS